MCEFIKAENAGNDYLYSFGEPWKKAEITALCSRRFGAGADGAVFIKKQNGTYFLRIFNADGSEADFCGNAAISAAELIYDCGLSKRFAFSVRTPAKTARAEIGDGFSAITTEGATIKECNHAENAFLNKLRATCGIEFADIFYAGNIHLGLKVCDLSKKFTDKIVKTVYSSGVFKNGINIEFFRPSFSGLTCGLNENVDSHGEKGPVDGADAVVFERGSGYTYSCGSGALAVFACYNLCVRKIFGLNVKYKGGVLSVQKSKNEEEAKKGFVRLIGTPRIIYRAVSCKNDYGYVGRRGCGNFSDCVCGESRGERCGKLHGGFDFCGENMTCAEFLNENFSGDENENR